MNSLLDKNKSIKRQTLAQERKQHILEKAVIQFLEYNDINLRNLSRDTNEHIPAIYKFFIDKHHLRNEVMSYIFSDIKQLLLADIDSFDHSLLRFTKFGLNYIRTAQKYKEVFRLLIHQEDEDLSYSIEILKIHKKLVSELYFANISIYPYDESVSEREQKICIDNISILSWAFVQGLGTVLLSAHLLSEHFEDIEDRIKDCFSRIGIISPEFLNNYELNSDILDQAMELIEETSFV